MNTELLKQSQEEYDNGTPIMSDDAFDGLTNSESQFDIADGTYTIEHAHYMGSMGKVHNEEDLYKVLPDGAFVQPKFDGVSCEIILENGVIKTVSTRGSGTHGKDLSHVGLFNNVTWNPELIAVYGELTLESAEPSQKDRNIVAGIVNQSSPSVDDVCKLRLHVFKAYRTNGMIPYSELDRVYLCNTQFVRPAMTYVVSKHSINNPHGNNLKLKFFGDLFNTHYPTTKRDGMVFKTSPGFLQLEDKFEIALKPQPQSSVSKITGVSWTKGKSKFAATALIEPITIDGVTISRVTLPNKYIWEMDIHINDYVEITRAGDVIPRIVKLVKEGDDRKVITPPSACPYGHQLVTVGKKIVCSKENCQSVSMEFTHSVKEILFWGIKRPPRSKMNKLISSGDVTIENILNVDSYKNKLTAREYELVKQGVQNYTAEDAEAKLLHSFNIDGLTLSKAREYIAMMDAKELLEGKGLIEDPIAMSLQFVYSISEDIRKFVGKLYE